jgi:RND family efflux transporter MFP subunit
MAWVIGEAASMGRGRGRFAILAAFAAALSLGACGEHSAAPPRPQAVGERWPMRETMVPELKPVAATITSRDTAEARARIGGTLVRLNVKEGDVVRRGQLIGIVSDPRLGLETSAYDGQVSAAQARAANAESELTRTQDLYDHGVYAKAKLDEAAAQAHAAQGALSAARSQRAASASLVGEGAILAPADGRVLHADTPAGSVVAAGQSVATLTSGPIVLRVEVPEADAGGLKVGQVATIAPDQPGAVIERAAIEQIYPAVTAGKVEIDLDAPSLSGEFVGRRVAMRLALGQRQALIAPARFIVTRSGVDYARVLAADGGADDVPVEVVAGADPGQVEVLSGLRAGDVLVAPDAAR